MSTIITPEVRAALTSGRLAHLVTLNQDGSPQVSCVYASVEDDEIVTAHLGEYQKVHNVRRDQRVALSVEADGDGPFPPYLTVTGTAVVQVGGAPDLLRRMTREYLGEDGVFPGDEAPDGYVLRITPTVVSGVGPWSRA
jgi:PPOX class probable F420-dependent enzyme